MSSTGSSELETQTTYAWNWFAYHAGQRLTAFNFFLVIVGVLTVGYGQAIVNRWEAVGVAIGTLGCIVGFGFVVLDIRNKHLVDAGSDALEDLEKALKVHLVTQRNGAKRTRSVFLSHTIVFRSVEVLVAVTFAASVAWAASNYSGIHANSGGGAKAAKTQLRSDVAADFPTAP